MKHKTQFTLLAAALTVAFMSGPAQVAQANSAFDFYGTIFKRPVNGIVNVRKFPSATSRVVGVVSNGQSVRVSGGACINSKTGREVDLTSYSTARQLYRAMKAPNVFCPVEFEDSRIEDGWVRGTHIMPN